MSISSMQTSTLPVFSAIKADFIESQVDELLVKNRQRIRELLANTRSPSEEFLHRMEQWDDELEQLWSPISHLNAVKNSAELRDVYNRCLPKLTEYATEMGQNRQLFKAYQQITNNESYDQFSTAQKKAVDNALRDFHLSGVALEGDQRQRYGDIKKRLAELSNQFSNNVLDATHGWCRQVEHVEDLAGVPEMVLVAYRQAAEADGKSGYLISLDIPAYLPLMQYCDNAELRQEMYVAYTTRASDLGPNAGQWDNSDAMAEILALRHELALLLGFDNYAERSLATKMADSPQQVEDFLNDLAEKSFDVAHKDIAELEQFARGQGVDSLQAWDIPYFSEKLRLQKYQLSQEELRPYFPVDKVIIGMFEVVRRLFGITIEEASADSWHSDVRFYRIFLNGKELAQFYLDLFAREHKRGGAWMAGCRVRRKLDDGSIQLPVAFLTCNFSAPSAEKGSLLTHNEVTTLFHEFGHGLHHMLSQIDCAAVSGINGVAWDAVELPSQFLENWCWDEQALELISGHFESGETLPEDMLEKMLAAKNFQAGMQMVRQLEFALFDIKLHRNYNQENPLAVQAVIDEVRSLLSVYPVPDFNRFQHSFGHIFAGGYAAGYYSYKWAELLSADAFSSFEESGIFNSETGARFLESILQQGGSKDPMELFVGFRGREPTVDALLRHSGIVSDGVVA